MPGTLSHSLHIWHQVPNLEITPGNQLGPTLSRSSRRVQALLKPADRDSLANALSIARQHRIPVYPISRGKNWGYGAHLPAIDDCVIISLERFQHIGPIHESSARIYLEPGVTQQQLYDHLQAKAPQFTFNVTAGGSQTSVLGNCLERGIGYHHSRKHELNGLTWMDMRGEIQQPDTRLWKPWNPQGVGPNLDPLFFQSNFGIVLGGWFTLMHRQPYQLLMAISHPRLPDLVEQLQFLYRDKLLDSLTHIADPERKDYVLSGLIQQRFPDLSETDRQRIVTRFARQDYTGITVLSGRKGPIRAQLREIRKILPKGFKSIAFSPASLNRVSAIFRHTPLRPIRDFGIHLEAASGLLQLCSGVPNDLGHTGIVCESNDPNKSPEGAYYFNATLPPDPQSTTELLKLLTGEPLSISTTFIVLPDSMLSAIITIHFKDEDAERTRQRMRSLTRAMIDSGFPPYRAGIDQMDLLDFPSINQKIKACLDPDKLISPGRYA